MEELLLRVVFWVFGFRLRALASLPPAPERRGIAIPSLLRRSSKHDYSRDLRRPKRGSAVILRCENPKPPMSVMGQKRHFQHPRLCPLLPLKWSAPLAVDISRSELTRTAGLSEDESHGQTPLT